MIKNSKQKQMTARELARNYKEVISQVDESHNPTIITSGNIQVALISIADLKILQDMKYKYSAKSLLEFANKSHNLLKDANLPEDLSTNHDKYFLEDE